MLRRCQSVSGIYSKTYHLKKIFEGKFDIICTRRFMTHSFAQKVHLESCFHVVVAAMI